MKKNLVILLVLFVLFINSLAATPDDDILDKRVTTRIECGAYFEVRDRALLAHATQIDPQGWFFSIPLDLQRRVWSTEDYQLVRSLVDAPIPEDDLFAGVDERVRV